MNFKFIFLLYSFVFHSFLFGQRYVDISESGVGMSPAKDGLGFNIDQAYLPRDFDLKLVFKIQPYDEIIVWKRGCDAGLVVSGGFYSEESYSIVAGKRVIEDVRRYSLVHNSIRIKPELVVALEEIISESNLIDLNGKAIVDAGSDHSAWSFVAEKKEGVVLTIAFSGMSSLEDQKLILNSLANLIASSSSNPEIMALSERFLYSDLPIRIVENDCLRVYGEIGIEEIKEVEVFLSNIESEIQRIDLTVLDSLPVEILKVFEGFSKEKKADLIVSKNLLKILIKHGLDVEKEEDVATSPFRCYEPN